MLKEYYNNLNKEEFNKFINNFEPFIIYSYLNNFIYTIEEIYTIILENKKNLEVVDILCTKIGEEFNGEESKCEYISLKLFSYIEGFISLKEGKKHWLDNLQDEDIQLYLSQLSTTTFFQLLGINESLKFPNILDNYELHQSNIWININSVSSSLHYDGNHNLLFVIEGWKDVILISPEYSQYLHSSPFYSIGCNHSSLTKVELEQILLLNNIPSYKIRLNSGDVLFIPEGWWHQVTSGSCTYAINYWFYSPLHKLLKNSKKSMTKYILRQTLHNLLTNELEKISTSLNLNKEEDDNNNDNNNINIHSLIINDCNNENINIHQLGHLFIYSSLEKMKNDWIPFSKQNPLLWNNILFSLKPEECYYLLNKWEEEEKIIDENNSVHHICQELLTPMIDGITSLEIRQSLINRRNEYRKSIALDILKEYLEIGNE